MLLEQGILREQECMGGISIESWQAEWRTSWRQLCLELTTAILLEVLDYIRSRLFPVLLIRLWVKDMLSRWRYWLEQARRDTRWRKCLLYLLIGCSGAPSWEQTKLKFISRECINYLWHFDQSVNVYWLYVTEEDGSGVKTVYLV